MSNFWLMSLCLDRIRNVEINSLTNSSDFSNAWEDKGSEPGTAIDNSKNPGKDREMSISYAAWA